MEVLWIGSEGPESYDKDAHARGGWCFVFVKDGRDDQPLLIAGNLTRFRYDECELFVAACDFGVVYWGMDLTGTGSCIDDRIFSWDGPFIIYSPSDDYAIPQEFRQTIKDAFGIKEWFGIEKE